MKKMKKTVRKKAIALFMMITMLMTLCSCSTGSDKSDQADTGLPQLVIGVDNYEPFNYIGEDRQHCGIDVELAKEACKRMGYRADIRQIDWEQKDHILESGKVDCLWSCYTMTGREEQYNWAGPYMNSHHVIMVRKNSRINKLSDLNGKIVAVQVGTKPEILFLDQNSGLPKVKNLVTFKSIDELISALRKGYVDAIAAHEAVLKQYTKEERRQYRFLSESISSAKLGVAFAKNGDHQMPDKLSRVLKEMIKDGTISRIAEKYGMDGEQAVKDL